MKRIIYSSLFLFCPFSLFAMHIAEGFLPVEWVIFWAVLFIPFLVAGLKRVRILTEDNTKIKLLYAVVGAFVFVLSSLKLPSVAGSSSHLTGVALGAVLFGASSMSVVGLVVLLFQALLLAHGGLTTLGANAVSMSVVGAFVAVGGFNACRKLRLSQSVSVFLAAFISDLSVYICTSFQLALAFQTATSSVFDNMIKFMSVFVVTQLPLAIAEGVLTVVLFKLILKYNRSEVALLNPKIQ